MSALLRFCYPDRMNPIDHLRQFRVGGFAMFDFAAGFLGMLLLSPLLSWLAGKAGVRVPRRNWVILMLPISVLAHVLAKTFTPLTKDFLDPNGHHLVKLIVLACCVLGATGIKRTAPATKVE